MKTISVMNLKGGVAKTISAANIAHILATVHKKRVLLIDNDKQGNVSKMFGVHDYDAPSIADILTQRKSILEVAKNTRHENLSVVPANMNLLKANLEILLDTTRPQQTRLRAELRKISATSDINKIDCAPDIKAELRKISDTADFCIIDCAPDINISTINALVASDLVLIPIKIDNFAFDGLAELKEQIENVREDFNPEISFLCFVTCFQNNEVNRQGEEWLKERRAEYPLLDTHIRRSVKVDESTFANAPIIEYSPRCGAAADYKIITSEIYRYCIALENYKKVSDSDTTTGK